jgi:imidazolonepropionase-like amidohydrolase
MVQADLVLRGGDVLDLRTGDTTRVDLGIRAGRVVVAAADTRDAVEVDAGGLTAMFGLWDCHPHPGSLMYDPRGDGFFEDVATRTIRAGANLQEAASMGVTGVRALGEAEASTWPGQRRTRRDSHLGRVCWRPGSRYGPPAAMAPPYPREHLRIHEMLVVDGPVEARRAIRSLVERGADWVKVLTGGLYSDHEAVDGGQFADDELVAVMRPPAPAGSRLRRTAAAPRWRGASRSWAAARSSTATRWTRRPPRRWRRPARGWCPPSRSPMTSR